MSYPHPINQPLSVHSVENALYFLYVHLLTPSDDRLTFSAEDHRQRTTAAPLSREVNDKRIGRTSPEHQPCVEIRGRTKTLTSGVSGFYLFPSKWSRGTNLGGLEALLVPGCCLPDPAASPRVGVHPFPCAFAGGAAGAMANLGALPDALESVVASVVPAASLSDRTLSASLLLGMGLANTGRSGTVGWEKASSAFTDGL